MASRQWSKKWILSLNSNECHVVSYGRTIDTSTTYTIMDKNQQTVPLAKLDKTRRWHVTISCQPDGRSPQPVRPWKSGRVHLAEGINVVVLEQEIRSVELGVCPMQLFHF